MFRAITCPTLGFWHRSAAFASQSLAANMLPMTAGFVMIGYPLAGFFIA